MIIGIHIPAGPWLFTEEVAASMVGQTFDAKVGDLAAAGEGRVLEARVVDGGRFIEAVVEWPEKAQGPGGAESA